MAKKKATSTPTSSSTKTAPVVPPLPPPAPPQHLILPPEDRRKTHYVLASGNQYVGASFEKLVDSLVEAFVTNVWQAAIGMAKSLATSPTAEHWAKPIVVKQLIVEMNGAATGVQDDDEDHEPIMTRSERNGWRGTLHDVALAQAAAVESFREEVVGNHMTTLSYSTIFKRLVDQYKADLAKPEGCDPDWYLCQFSARLFYAGVCGGRLERGQRTKIGELLFDAAEGTVDPSSPVTPA